MSGLIGFVGIIVPHTMRLLVSTSYRAVVPLSLVVGGGFLVLTDVLARTVLSPQELPIGVDHRVLRRAVLRHRPARARHGSDRAAGRLGRARHDRRAARLSFAVARGEWVALIGPNGAGKTTALRALCRLVTYAGEDLIDGADMQTLGRRAARARARVRASASGDAAGADRGRVRAAGPHALSRLLRLREPRGPAAAERSLERLELREFAGRLLGSLSGGELQRAVLARALAQEAPILLLDEPTSALDLGRQQQALELVHALRDGGLTIVSTMHDLTLAGQYADRLVLLDRGEVVAEGPPAEVLSALNVASYYGANVRVVHDEAGVFVLPLRR